MTNKRRLWRSMWAWWLLLLLVTPYFRDLQIDGLARSIVGWNVEVQNSFGRSLSEAAIRTIIVMFIANILYSYKTIKSPSVIQTDERLLNKDHLFGLKVATINLGIALTLIVIREYANLSYLEATDEYNIKCRLARYCADGSRRMRTGEHWTNLFGIAYVLIALISNRFVYRRVFDTSQVDAR